VVRTKHQQSARNTFSSSSRSSSRPQSTRPTARPYTQRPRSSSPKEEKQSRRLFRCFACKKEDHRWRECPYIEGNMEQIRRIILDVRIKEKGNRKPKAKAYVTGETDSESENSALSTEEDEAFPASLQLPNVHH